MVWHNYNYGKCLHSRTMLHPRSKTTHVLLISYRSSTSCEQIQRQKLCRNVHYPRRLGGHGYSSLSVCLFVCLLYSLHTTSYYWIKAIVSNSSRLSYYKAWEGESHRSLSHARLINTQPLFDVYLQLKWSLTRNTGPRGGPTRSKVTNEFITWAYVLCRNSRLI